MPTVTRTRLHTSIDPAAAIARCRELLARNGQPQQGPAARRSSLLPWSAAEGAVEGVVEAGTPAEDAVHLCHEGGVVYLTAHASAAGAGFTGTLLVNQNGMIREMIALGTEGDTSWTRICRGQIRFHVAPTSGSLALLFKLSGGARLVLTATKNGAAAGVPIYIGAQAAPVEKPAAIFDLKQ